MINGLTSHEVWYIDNVTSFLGILVSEESAIRKLPPENVGNKDDYAFLWRPFIWSSHIGREAMKCNLSSCGLSCMDGATDTIATLNSGHFVRFYTREVRLGGRGRWKYKYLSFGRAESMSDLLHVIRLAPPYGVGVAS
jgi:hypothetical protein